ncbi:MAG: filamentous hemagglutinin N-terminal domain-containing protein [Stigonema ocellatum SAG 48.90 = DSM 106950]|nr:filamentous hemagglutinin N-terminal domain-containing protein [Stigonema ocellatum SAG 48.90 = DSM 106950]
MCIKSWLSRCWWLGMSCSLAIGGAIANWDNAKAQPILDATLGGERSVVTPNVVINGLTSDRIDGGAIRGSNLFHSFSEFNVGEGRGVYFTNPVGIQNILSRVTGKNPSNILGTLGVTGGNANLFLINPNGIIFGQNASLDVGGSFVATTANAIGFGKSGFFSASAPNVPLILTVNPSAFLFNQVANQPITNQSVAGLSVPAGASLLLLGGNVSLDGGTLQAQGGQVELGGLASSGTVGLNIDGNNLSLSFPDGVERADVSLTKDADVFVRAGGGGSIAINAQNVNLAGGSKLRAGIEPNQGSVDSIAGNIEINATGAIKFTEGSYIQNFVRSNAVGKSGDINIQAESVSFTDGSNLIAGTFGKGDAGNVNINARDQVSFNGEDQGSNRDFGSSGVYNRVQPGAVGNGGNINVTTGSLHLTNGAILTTSIYGQGNGGNVTINARDRVSFDGEGSIDTQSSGAYSAVNVGASGRAGSVNVTTGSLYVTNGAHLSTTILGRGDAGSVTINARDSVFFDGEGSMDGESSGVFSEVQSLSGYPEAVGQGGNVKITTGSLSVTNGAVITTSTDGRGDGGSVTINARDRVSLDGEGRLQTNESGNFRHTSGVFSTVEKFGVGHGGSINVTAGSLYVTNGAALAANTLGQGDPGMVNINVRDTASFDGKGKNPNFFSSGVSTQVTANAVGQGGSVNITAGLLYLTNDALLSASSDGKGDAGNVSVAVRGTLQANNGNISTNATQAGGGNVDITARDIRLRNNSAIKTNSGGGNGGNITLNAKTIVALEDSDILAFAPQGQGGNITFNTRAFLSSPLYRPTPPITDTKALDALEGNGRVDVNASGAVPGVISGVPDISFLQNSLTELPTNLIDTNNLIANSCIARSPQQKGSFIITGAGGLPTQPDEPANAPFPTYVVPTVGAFTSLPSSVSGTNSPRPWKKGDPIIEPQGVYQLPSGQLVLSRECR